MTNLFTNIIKGKKVLFITTKNLDYIRNTQEISLLRTNASSVDIIGSYAKSYPKRLLEIYKSILIRKTNLYDIVFIGFAPQLIIPFFGHKFKRLIIVEDFFISLYDTLCNDRQKFKPNRFIGRFLFYLDKKTLNNCNYIISDTNAHGDYFSKEFKISRDKIFTLYLEADKSIYHPISLPRPPKYNNKFLVLYFGSILPLQGTDIILDAINLLKDNSSLHFIFIGPIKDDVSKPQSNNIEYINWLSQEDLAKYINWADLCLAGHFNSSIEKAKRTIPGKAYIYKAINKPMILGDNPANHELFSNDNNVTFVEMGNSAKLSECILSCHHLSQMQKI